jgi:hypothetical protein
MDLDLLQSVSHLYNFQEHDLRVFTTMKKFLVVLQVFILTIVLLPSAPADWKFESTNKPSGLTAYATSYWIDGVGPVNYYGLMRSDLEYETYYGALMIQCTKKKYLVSMSLMQTGSAHESMALDDPGYIRLQFQNLSSTRKITFATYGLGLEGALVINANTKTLISNIIKSRTLRVQFKKKSGKTLNAVFDTRDLTLGKTRFAYAGCKF